MNTLLKVMKNEKTPLLRNLIVLPLVLNPDPDEGIIIIICVCQLVSKCVFIY